jgi:hypothetical protein
VQAGAGMAAVTGAEETPMLHDHVSLIPMKGGPLTYQQAKAVEAQRALYDLRAMVDIEAQQELLKVVDKSIAAVNLLVGTVLASRLVLKGPIEKLQEELDLQLGSDIAETDKVAADMRLRKADGSVVGTKP